MPSRHFVPFEDSDERTELHDQRRQLRTLCDEQRRELVRRDKIERDLLRENAALRDEIARLRFWRRWLR